MILTVIGGGSSQWMRKLMRDVYLLDEPGGEIRLVDPQRELVEAVGDMLRKFNELRDKSYEINVIVSDSREDRRAALANANFVMTTFSPGSMDAFENDLEIPIKYGIRQPVSMTVGPCGVSAAIRTAPVAHEIVEDMEAVCPNARLLNVTNPMSVVTRAMNMAADNVPVISMCHEFHSARRHFPEILGLEIPEGMNVVDYLYDWLPKQGFEYTVAGLNHFIWLTKATLNGEDVLPKFREYARTPRKLDDPYSNPDGAKIALCEIFGYWSFPGDRHLVEFWPSLCNIQNGFGMAYGVRKTTVDRRRWVIPINLGEIRQITSGEMPVDWSRSGEEMTAIMNAILKNESATAILNLPNTGQIENLPKDVVVETLATVSADDVTPKPSGALPGPIGTLCRLHADVHELTVQAALRGDRGLLVQAMALDPLSAGADFAALERMTDELLLANKQWLPRFFD